jgi:threonylcarbamoyladenosine tRNA methylthiotransferase MtaB
MPEPKVLVAATGCKLNQAEADLWKAWFVQNGYELAVDARQEASVKVCLVTTCTVTGRADRSSVALIRRLHRRYPNAEIKVTGCGATRIPERMAALPGVSEIIEYTEKERSIGDLSYGKDGISTECINRNRAFLRAGEGCDRRCAYCIVSSIRGPVRSKPKETILEELHALREQGFGEVVLVALNLGLWGKERGESLAGLLGKIEQKQGRLPRIRLTSLEPDTVTDELLEVLASNPRFCPHLHIPLQSGDDRILEEMDRPYRTKEFARLMDKVERTFPDACIGTDIITSTPGEDDESFARTLGFIRNLPLNHLHVFTYSPRPGTPMFARRRKCKHNPREETRILREEGVKKSLEFRRRFMSKTRQAVLLSPTRALTDNYIDVRISRTSRPVRSLADVKITGVTPEETKGIVK